MATPSCGGGGGGDRMGQGEGGERGVVASPLASRTRAGRPVSSSSPRSPRRAETNAFHVNFNLKHFDRETAAAACVIQIKHLI